MCGQELDSGGSADMEAGTSGTTLSPANDDLALRAALYGVEIQSYADKVCCVVLRCSTDITCLLVMYSSVLLLVIFSIFYRYYHPQMQASR